MIFVPGIVLPLSLTIPPCQSNITTRVPASFIVRVPPTKNMKVLLCTTILVISISAVYCISPPNGTCANTAYHYCDWAGWGTWSNCSTQCGTGTQERKRFICCPPEYNASSILQCVKQLCAHSVSDYIKHQSCTSSAGCQGRGWQIQLWNVTAEHLEHFGTVTRIMSVSVKIIKKNPLFFVKKRICTIWSFSLYLGTDFS